MGPLHIFTKLPGCAGRKKVKRWVLDFTKNPHLNKKIVALRWTLSGLEATAEG